MIIEKMGFACVSLTGWQAGFKTNINHCNARIETINTTRLLYELEQKKIVIVAGFQGIDKFDDITTLGRGGSDTSAVAIAAALNADLCQIYSDVDGIYTADPNLVNNALKLTEISFDEMLELASLGAQVLHNRSVEMAKRYNVNMEVLSSFNKSNGTKLKEKVKMEKMLIRGVTRDDFTARIDLIGVPNKISLIYQIFALLGKNNINVDLIVKSAILNEKSIISFTVALNQMEITKQILEEHKESLKIDEIKIFDSVSKVSIVGAGMQTNSGVAAKFFEALYSADINVQIITTSEIKISVLINKSDSAKAVQLIHEKFFN